MATHRGRTVKTASTTWRGRITSHETFTHDSLDSLGYDWGRIADPGVRAVRPLKVYLPESTEEVVQVVKEARALGQHLTIRSKGHSSNDLVLSDRGAVLLTQGMDRILEVDTDRGVARVQAGAISAQLDDHLAPLGWGLPVIGDHNDITVGGFASVGGISASAHRHGLFVDNVEALTYVNWDGEVIDCSRDERPDHYNRVLTGLGRWGVITEMTLRIIPIDKYGTIWQNDIEHFFGIDKFIAGSTPFVLSPPDHALMMRGIYADMVIGGRPVGAGQFSVYHATEQSGRARLRDKVAYGALHGLGYLGGRLPRKADMLVKDLGMAGVLLSPKFASVKNVEFFTDKVLEATVGDPTRFLVVLGPVEQYAELCREFWSVVDGFRARTGALTFISLYVKSIHSPYLGGGDPARSNFCEFLFYVGMHRERMTPALLDELVDEVDDLALERGCLRYMHSKTSADPERRRRLNPNTMYAGDDPPQSGDLALPPLPEVPA